MFNTFIKNNATMKASTILSVALVFISVSFLTRTGFCQASWKQRANYSGGETHSPFYMVINGKAYVGAGLKVPAVKKKDCWEYDPSLNVWTQKADFPGTPRWGARGFGIGDFGYVGTGWTPSATNSFYKYNAASNTWSMMTWFPGSARYTTVTFTLSGFGYMGLGFSPCKSDYWRYDPNNDSWTQISNFPGGARQNGVSFVIDNFAYVGTGMCTGTAYKDFYKYNSLSNQWTQIASLPTTTGRVAGFAFSISGLGYYVAGCDYTNTSAPFTIYNDFYQYEPITDTWKQLPDFPGVARFDGAYFSINNKGYIGLGSDTTTYTTHYLDDLWEYSFDSVTVLSESIYQANGIRVYPNPAVHEIRFSSNDQTSLPLEVTLFTSQGRSVMSFTHNDEKPININTLAPGIYFLKILQKSTGTTHFSRFVKSGY